MRLTKNGIRAGLIDGMRRYAGGEYAGSDINIRNNNVSQWFKPGVADLFLFELISEPHLDYLEKEVSFPKEEDKQRVSFFFIGGELLQKWDLDFKILSGGNINYTKEKWSPTTSH